MGNLGSDPKGSPGGQGTTDPAARQSPIESNPGRRRKKPGPGHLGKRASRTEMEERIIGVAKLLIKRIHKCQIKDFLASKYDLGSRQAESYITMAQRWMLDRIGRSREELVAEALGFYEEILRDPEADPRRKDDAQLAIRQMMGLDKPFKIAPTTPDGGSPYVSQKAIAAMSDEELAVLRKLHLRIQQQRLIESGEAVAADVGNVVDAMSVTPAVDQVSAD